MVQSNTALLNVQTFDSGLQNNSKHIKIYKVKCYDKGEIHSPYVHVADRVAGICEEELREFLRSWGGVLLSCARNTGPDGWKTLRNLICTQ